VSSTGDSQCSLGTPRRAREREPIQRAATTPQGSECAWFHDRALPTEPMESERALDEQTFCGCVRHSRRGVEHSRAMRVALTPLA
jgi:hypothetical protein